ncbi:anti-sigma factor family protein [Aquibium microcysteis]|uniref:anti-sigma factor family protein n=1 Tax=Aquibium microcysteis TaxID=675281 RepID=UPI00165CF8B8|nr:anti-sigma factor [Aquibium microcysteis]
MNAIADPVTDTDLDAYVDDQLDVARRIEVESYLAARPETAARVMADLRNRDELRLAMAGAAGAPRPATADAARRLERGLVRGRVFGMLQRAAAVTVFVAAGWFANDALGPFRITEVVASTPPPAYVEDAMRAHGTSMLRASMASQPEVPVYSAEEIRAATAIVMPALPSDWGVRDVQIYPSRFGPSVEMTLDAGDLGYVSLFAVRPGTFDVVQPTLAPAGDVASAYFQIGEVAYALVASADVEQLDRAAGKLSATLY